VKWKKPESVGSVSVNMTPMIDMVFNLLIFFILTAQFVRLETEEVILPLSITAVNKDYTEFRNVVINIVNPENPHVVVFGKTIDSNIRQSGTSELTEYLKEMHESAEGKQINVILRADADIPYEEVAKVMLDAGAAQIQGWWITTEIEDLEKQKK
jgi:biopolymer transport protein ExbD